ncbi:MAG: VanZ family protein [Syntrophobacterales bacterium]|jgi:VanZ family protein
MVRSAVQPSRWRIWAPPVIWALAIMLMSGDLGSSPHTYPIFKWIFSTFTNLNPKTIKVLHSWFRKSLHFICYGFLSVLWYRSLVATIPERRSACLILALVLTLGVSIIDEGHQTLMTNRTGTLKDVGLDMAGAIVFTFFTARYWKRKAPVSFGVESPFP